MILKINKFTGWLANKFVSFKILYFLEGYSLPKTSCTSGNNKSFTSTRFNKVKAPWHLVDPSPWPVVVAMLLFSLTVFLVAFMHCYDVSYFFLGLTTVTLIYALLSWGRDVIIEGTFQGHHNRRVRRGFTYGIVLFILSEVMFFFSFFWAFFHSALIPSDSVGGVWPPIGILPLNSAGIALLNTTLLLTSGLTITWSHWAVIYRKREEAIKSLFFTILLGVVFLFCQFYEYLNCPFSISDGIFGACFFMITGLHGMHVFLGVILLNISFVRLLNYHFTQYTHVGFTLAVWYWHFVDAIWIFVFAFLYYWGEMSYPTALDPIPFIEKLTLIKDILSTDMSNIEPVTDQVKQAAFAKWRYAGLAGHLLTQAVTPRPPNPPVQIDLPHVNLPSLNVPINAPITPPTLPVLRPVPDTPVNIHENDVLRPVPPADLGDYDPATDNRSTAEKCTILSVCFTPCSSFYKKFFNFFNKKQQS